MVLRAAAIMLAVMVASCSNPVKIPSCVSPPTPENGAVGAHGDRSGEGDRTHGAMRLRPVFATEDDDIANRLAWNCGRYAQGVGDDREIPFSRPVRMQKIEWSNLH